MIPEPFSDNSPDKLEESLALLAAGLAIEEVLAQAGEDAAWLRPLLEVASEVQSLQTAVPVPDPAASLAKMLAQAATMRANATPDRGEPHAAWWVHLANLGPGRLRAVPAVLLLLVLLLLGLVGLATPHSLPGQPLYGLKRSFETLQLNWTGDEVRRDQLLETFNERRQVETKQLLEQKVEALVTFEGTVEAVTAQNVTVDGFWAVMTANTEINGPLATQAKVRMQGRTNPNGGLTLLAITVLQPAPPTPTPSPTPSPFPTETPTPTPTPSATATPTSTPTSSPTATASATARPTRTPTASPTLTAPATATPQPTQLKPAPTPTPVATSDDSTNRGPDSDEGTNDNNDNSGADSGGNDNSGPDPNDNGDDSADNDNNDNSGGGSGSDNSNDDHGSDDSGSDSGGDNDNSNSDNDNDHSGSGGGNSGSGGGDDHDNSGSGSGNSGSGSGDDDDQSGSSKGKD
jgi:uncharacterized membrane protein YgcG